MKSRILPLLLASLPILSAEEEFTPLFNGKDLTGWVPVNIAPETFHAEDGILKTTGSPTGLIRTDRMYENCIIEFEWRHLKVGGNSGLFVWADGLPFTGSAFGRGIECQVLDSEHEQEGKNVWWSPHGDLFPVNGAKMTVAGKISPDGKRSFPSEERVKSSPQWNHYRLEARDGDLSLAVNGKVVTIAKDISPRKGYLMFESEGSEAHFRNIKIAELPSTNPEGPEVAEDATGFRPIFTGLDLRGWKVTEGPEDAWKVNDGVLTATADDDSPRTLRLEKTPENFELVIDWKTTGDATAKVTGLPLKTEEPEWTRFQVDSLTAPVEIEVTGKGTLVLRNLFLRELKPDGSPKIEDR